MAKKLLLIFFICIITMFSSEKTSAQSIDSTLSWGYCGEMSLWVIPDTTLNVTIAVDFGDGTSASLSSDSAGIYPFYHFYLWPGTYALTITMFQNSVPVDTVYQNFIRNTGTCSVVNNYFYHDLNSNCIKDNNEPFSNLNIVVEVDSNFTPIDTFTVQNGFFYPVASQGDIYTFKIISTPPGINVMCPISGAINDTLGQSSQHDNWFALDCTTNTFDLGIQGGVCAAATIDVATIMVENPLCMGATPVFTFTHSNKYQYNFAYPVPTGIVNNVITWNLNSIGVMAGTTSIPLSIELSPVGTLNMGDTVHHSFAVTPATGDANPANNTVFIVDTIVGPYDPNAIYVQPETCVTAGTILKYRVTFENLGNGPAQNVYVLDTLPAGVDPASLRIVYSTHDMFIGSMVQNGQTVLKFDFSNIMLADSSDHLGRAGSFAYTINTKNNLLVGAQINNRVGIYFDTNPVVLTNTVGTSICWPQSVETTVKGDNFILFPNPANETISVKTENYNTYEIKNTIGQLVQEGSVQKGETKIGLTHIPPGIYYITITHAGGTQTQKFHKQ